MNAIPTPSEAEVPDFILGDFKLSPGSGVVWVERGWTGKNNMSRGDGDVSLWKVFESGEDQLMGCFGEYLQFLFKQVAIL